MKTTDFRIGNYLRDQKGRLCEVYELRQQGEVKATAIEGPFTSLPCEPIPLTEEEVISLGFEKLSPTSYRKVNGDLNFQIILSAIGSGYNTASAITRKPLHFVNELQNMWHTLSGEELTLKEGGMK